MFFIIFVAPKRVKRLNAESLRLEDLDLQAYGVQPDAAGVKTI